MQVKGIDVSCAQRKINWQAVKAAGIEFAMIRAGFGDDISQKDSEFDNNVQGALSAGIHVGCYWFSYACSVADAIKEAQVMKKIITPYSGKMDYPMAFDFEGDSITHGFAKVNGRNPTTAEVQAMTDAFIGEMEKGCWYATNYTNINYVKNYNSNHVGSDKTWLADYNGGNPAYPCGMQQTASDGHVNGISTNVDMNTAHIDFSSIIRAAHLNGYVNNSSTPAPTIAPQSTPAPTTSHKHHVGENIVFSSCHPASTSIDTAIPASKMQRDHGTITKVLDGVPNPYLLDGGLCWVNDGQIFGAGFATPAAQATLAKGDKVKVTNPIDCDGNKITLYYPQYDVIQVSGSKVLVGIRDVATAWFESSHLSKL
ncbi:MAG TPA: GH25 family lysozyme [Oscillospiraceae bacterium]|nr:GH25 family lysozyme [Oscillospiraceae bacterium]